MAHRNVTVTAESADLLRALSSLAELLERIPELLDGLVDIGKLRLELGSVVMSNDAALGTGNVRALLKPSDRLLALVTALSACERELLVAKELAHS
jgi:hypothetical protein